MRKAFFIILSFLLVGVAHGDVIESPVQQVEAFSPIVIGYGANYYVDADASSGGDGSISSPWNELSDITGVSPGDNVYLDRGDTWYESMTLPTSGTSGNPITYSAYGTGALPIIDGQDTLTTGINLSGRDCITIEYIEIKDFTDYGITANNSVINDYITIDNVTFSGMDDSGIWVERVDDSTISNCTFTDITDYAIWLAGKRPVFRSDCTTNPPGGVTAISCNDLPYSSTQPAEVDWADNITIYNNTVTNATIKLNTIRNSEVSYNVVNNPGQVVGEDTIYKSGFGHTSYWWSGVEFHHNEITLGTNDYDVIACEIWHIENDTLFHNNTSNGWFSLARNPTGDSDPYSYRFYDNTLSSSVEGGLGSGQQPSSGALEVNKFLTNVLVENNLFEGTNSLTHGFRYGIFTSGGTVSDIVIRNNTFKDLPRRGISIALNAIANKVVDIDDWEIYNNTFLYIYTDGNADSDRQVALHIIAPPNEADADDIIFHDNYVEYGNAVRFTEADLSPVEVTECQEITNVDVIHNTVLFGGEHAVGTTECFDDIE